MSYAMYHGLDEAAARQLLPCPFRPLTVSEFISIKPLVARAYGALGVAQEENHKQRLHEQDVFDRVVFFLAALTVRLFSRVLGADEAPFRPVVGKRGDAGATAGTATTGGGSSARGVTTGAASASVTPSRCARAASERAGASPRARSAASNAGKSM